LSKKVNAYEKIINEQKNKIRYVENQNQKLEVEINNLNNIVTIQNNVIEKSRHINNTLYDRIKQK
jgi:uncharacterized coiled-coil protein SlyX